MSIKKLAGQTLWYGVPTITGKFLSYFLNLLLIWLYEPVNISSITQLYVLVPFLNIVFTYGLETAFFRFVKEYPFRQVYGTLMLSIIASTFLFSILFLPFIPSMTVLFKAQDHPGFFYWMMSILIFDTITALPFAKLRYDERPRKFAFVKMMNIVIHLSSFVFFIALCPILYQKFPNTLLLSFYNPNYSISYYVIANILASVCTLFFLRKEIFSTPYSFDSALWKKVMQYSLPLLIVGLGGMVNELLSRLCYTFLAVGSDAQVRHELGVFSGVYRIVMMVNIFIFAYRMAAEPFFFKKSVDANAKEVYARLMKVFVIACCFIFLFITLFIDIWEIVLTLKSKAYAEAISIVPILSLGSVFLGIYYNQSVWYKLSDQNKFGAYITLGGALITILANVILIPLYKYNGAAWANLLCYVFMMLTSYFLGQKYYPIQYPLKRILTYLFCILTMYLLHQLFSVYVADVYLRIGAGSLLFGLFIFIVICLDGNEFASLPMIGKYFVKR